MLDGFRRIVAERLRAPELINRLGAALKQAWRPLAPYADRLRQKTAPTRAAAQAWYDKREPREKTLLQIAGALIALLLLYGLIYSPIMSLRASLNDRVAQRVHDLVEMRRLMPRYQRLQQELIAAQHRTVPDARNFSLFSVVQQSLTRSLGKEKIDITRGSEHQVPGGYRQYTVNVKLTGLSLAQVVDTLYGVQSLAVPISVSNLELRRHANDTHVFDADLTCSALGKDQ